MPVPDDQSEAIAFLADPASYEPGVDRVERIDTHISRVFLAGERVYKLKRAVKLPYLDFSTAARRHAACARELALNRRTAPQLYLGLRALGRTRRGDLGWAEAGTAADWVVVMRRFDQGLLFDALAQRGELTAMTMRDLSDRIVAFHEAAEPRPDHGGGIAFARIVERNQATLRRIGDNRFAADALAALRTRQREALSAVAQLIDQRRAAGKVRHCHGDLHLRNICLIDGAPVLFDCLEFSEELASIDVLYDLAFLLMDLEHRRLRGFANQVLNRYLDLTDTEEGLAALPLYLSVRAAIRAEVAATAAAQAGATAEHQAEEARAYLRLAGMLVVPQPPRLIALGGVSGTGKSTLARQLAPELGLSPGARVLRSDVIRKRLCDVAPETRLPPAAYDDDMTRRVYQELGDRAAATLRAGYCAIVDAVSLRPAERAAFADIARAAGVPFAGLWLEAAPATLAARIAARHGDASDATADIMREQLARDPGPIEWQRVEVGGDVAAATGAVRRALDLPA